MRTRIGLVLVSTALLLGCPLSGQSKPARMQEAAQELNLNTRFGRMELAAERVSPKARAAFFDRRKGWGGQVRIADWELAGMRLDGDAEAETTVRIAWYRANEGDLKVTTLKQKWHDFKGDWKLTDEVRIDGEIGLLGEPPPPATDTAPKRTQFPTIRLGGAGAPPAGDPPRLDD
ncbi:MAG: hypothetical protein JST00_05645 [Deltaproteobacteria bacterium]|nr:hypothetical protein [Deltaproteobacteria bacterium]